MKKRSTRSAKNRPHGRSNLRQVFFVVVALGSTLGLGALATDQYVVLSQRQAAAAVAAANGDDLYTGSILYMPDSGDHEMGAPSKSSSRSEELLGGTARTQLCP